MKVLDPEGTRFQYAYNRWANARILEAAAALEPERLQQELGTSHRSVFGTLAHILWAEWRWLGRWLAPAPPPGPDPLICTDLPSLRAGWTEVEQAQAAFLDRLSEEALETPVTYENPPGTPWTYPLWQMLHHLVNHSTYHRGQVTTLLRQLGAGAVATDFLVFIDEQTRVAEAASSAGLRAAALALLDARPRPPRWTDRMLAPVASQAVSETPATWSRFTRATSSVLASGDCSVAP